MERRGRFQRQRATKGQSFTEPTLPQRPLHRFPSPLLLSLSAAARFVAGWRWDVKEDDVCGICREAFESCCPTCKVPGDDCPPMWGACNHAFHMHCIMKWLDAGKDREQQCPLCRRAWEFKPNFLTNPPSFSIASTF